MERTLSGIDNDTLRVDEVRLGPSTGLDSGTSGTFYLDGFESRRSSYTLAPAAQRSGVGPLAGLLPGGRSHPSAGSGQALAALRHSLRSQGRLLPQASERDPGFFARLTTRMHRALAAAFLPGMLVQPAAAVLSAPPAGQTLQVPSGQAWKTYYYAGSQRVAMRELTASGGNTLYYLHADHLGSTSLTTCGTATTEGGCDGIALGGEVARQLYLPYGGIRYATGTMPTDIGYTGQRADDTGLMHYGARYYSPVVGRFVSADTIVPDPANPQSLNRYSYTLNNPVKYTDPTGYREVECAPGESGCDNSGQLLTPPSSDAPSLDGPLEDYSSVSEPITGSPGQSNNDWIDEFLANESKYGHRYCGEQHQCPVPIWQLDPDFVAELLGLVPVQTPSGMSFVLMAKPGKGSDEEDKGTGGGGGGSGDPDILRSITQKYKRPSGSTTPAQRAAVQGKPCAECGRLAPKMYADHKNPLVVEYYTTGSIDTANMRSLNAVQSHCPTCSNAQGGMLSAFARRVAQLLGLK